MEDKIRKKKITITEIARLANVSPATVSRVFNPGKAHVAQKTVEKVQAVLKDLGLSLNVPDANPSKARPVLLLNTPDNNPFYAEVIQGVLSSVNSHHCHLLMTQSPLDHGSVDDFIALIERVNAAGVIILNQVKEDVLYQIESKIPVIQCCEFNPMVPDIPFVSIQDAIAASEATKYLLSRGRNKIAFINGPSTYKYARERKKGFQDAMESAGLFVPKQWIVNLPEINYEMAYSAICQILNMSEQPNAFFTASDLLAAAVLKAAHSYHLQIPQDIMVVGFDNTQFSTTCTPSITSVKQPMFQEGFTASEMLLQRIQSPEAHINSIYLETELIVRETT
jgi:LacI family repressor for deo operon, udp, cdd, tsx, nupC, and nupG